MQYAFTIKKMLGSPEMTVESDYRTIMKSWKIEGLKIPIYSYENDTRGRLHIHGIVLIPEGYYRKNLITRGFSLKLVEIHNFAGWLDYLGKDRIDESIEDDHPEIDPTIHMKIPTKNMMPKYCNCMGIWHDRSDWLDAQYCERI